jgi:uncharacterized protein (DUF305 family)
MKISILMLFFSLITANSCKNTDAEETMQMNNSMPMENEVMQSMNKTNSMMNSAKMNGDFDYDYANLMIMHHQMAIDMSLVEIEKGSDQTIKDMAKGIVAAQEIEIREMQQFIQKYKIPNTNNQTSNSYKIATEMKSMMNKMNEKIMNINIDNDYVTMMIPHHESAVEMAKMQLQYGKQDALIELSKNIIDDQSYEIDEFKKWQTNN